MIYVVSPILVNRLWGGDKLGQIYHKSADHIGEAWILSCLGNYNSKLDNGKTLQDIFNENKNIVKEGYTGEFPLLIKLIDARDDLSIQVHPDVKTESWHILNKTPSSLYLGFKNNTSKEEVNEVLNKGDITTLLNKVSVKEGDTYLINPGTIHAIGKGTFLIEIQQSADVTYRLYDFNRVDSNGKKRELHIDKALNVINYQKLDVKDTKQGNLIVSSPYFHVYKHIVDGELNFDVDKQSFVSLTVIDGSGEVVGNTNSVKLDTFATAFIPAGEGICSIKGKLTVILVTL